MWVEGGRDAIEERHRTVFVTAESTRGVEPVGSPGSRSWRRTGERGDGMYLEAGGQRFRDRAPESGFVWETGSVTFYRVDPRFLS